MDNAWQRYLETATELTAITRRRAESVVRSLVKQGEVAADRAERSVEELLARSERNRRVITDLVTKEVERAVGRLRLVRREELDRLATRVARVEAETGASSASGTQAARKKATGKKVGTKKAATKKAATKKAATKKAATKKAATKKAATKKAATKKATGKKATTRSAAAKKTTGEGG